MFFIIISSILGRKQLVINAEIKVTTLKPDISVTINFNDTVQKMVSFFYGNFSNQFNKHIVFVIKGSNCDSGMTFCPNQCASSNAEIVFTSLTRALPVTPNGGVTNIRYNVRNAFIVEIGEIANFIFR